MIGTCLGVIEAGDSATVTIILQRMNAKFMVQHCILPDNKELNKSVWEAVPQAELMYSKLNVVFDPDAIQFSSPSASNEPNGTSMSGGSNRDSNNMKNETQKLVQELESVRKEMTESEQKRKSSDQKWEEIQATCEELKAENERLREKHRKELVRLKKKEEKKRQQFAQILEDMEGQTEQTWTELQEKYNQLEQDNKGLEVQHVEDEKELVGEQALEKSDDMANDEFMLNIEMNSFQPLFNEIQHKVTELGKRIFSVRNNQTRRELTQKLTPATDISCEVEETVVTVLKNERDKLQTALDLLLSLETEFPAASSNQGIHPGDARLLD